MMPRAKPPLFAVCLVALVGALFVPSLAWALIETPLPLGKLLSMSAFVAVAKVDRVNAERKAVVLAVETDLKGMLPSRRLVVDLTADNTDEANKLYTRLGKSSTVLVTLAEEVDDAGAIKQYVGLIYLDGSWFQLLGTPAGESINWRYTHAEPYLRRTFRGSVPELRAVIESVLAGTAQPPPHEAAEKPGLGPELPESERALPTLIPTTTATPESVEHVGHGDAQHDAAEGHGAAAGDAGGGNGASLFYIVGGIILLLVVTGIAYGVVNRAQSAAK